MEGKEEAGNEKPPEKAAEKKDDAPYGEWQNVVKPRKEGGRKWAYAAVVIVVFAVGFLAFFQSPLTGLFLAGGVQEGDTVSVWYEGRLEDGTLFDTNRQTVAQEESLVGGSYEPLEFTVGSGQIIPGFEEAVLGMVPGEVKTVTVQPEDAYGEPNPALVQKVPRREEIDRVEKLPIEIAIPADQFLGFFGMMEEGDTFTYPESTLEYEVTEVGEDVKARLSAEVGDTVKIPNFRWNSTVIAVDGNNVTLRHEPTEGTVDTQIGKTNITFTGEKIFSYANPMVGMSVPTGFGTARVTAVDGENITIDMNHPLAGKALIFRIELLNVEE